MDKQLSDETFEARLQHLIGNVLCYVDFKKSSSVDVIVLHEHLGLQNYVRVMVQSLTYNQFSIIYPNLFEEGESQSQDDNTAYLRSLNHQKIGEILLTLINYVAARGNKIVLVGFSLGAAIGLKMLEYTNKVEMGFFFYGIPPLRAIRAQEIQAKATIFVGTQDNIQHLSNGAVRKKAKQIYANNPNITWIDMEGGKHGFMNPACDNYDENLFGICCQQFHKQTKKLIAQHQPSKVRISAPPLSSFESLPNRRPFQGSGPGIERSNQSQVSATSIKGVSAGQDPQKKEQKQDSGCILY